MVFSDEQRIILTTLLYSDIFHFPLTEEELWQRLISDTPITKKAFRRSLKTLPQISYKDGYYCIKGKEASITKRKKYLADIAFKKQLAQKTARRLSRIPTIFCIGLSGGLSVGNGTDKDDIDFFIITKKNTLFITRLQIVILLELLGLRRSWKMKHAANKICVNLLIDETQLAWPSDKHDLYTAHEIAQMQPLYERNGIYGAFLQANTWITSFFPNWHPGKQKPMLQKANKSVFIFTNNVTEVIARFLQKVYMQRHRTTEKVEKQFLAFHPKDYRLRTLSQLRSKCKQFGLLTKF